MENKFYLKLIVVLALSLSFLFNSIRIIWKKTETPLNSDSLKVACLSGGGKVISNELGNYVDCEKSN